MSIIITPRKVINFKVVYYGPAWRQDGNLQFVHRCLPDDNRGKT